MEVPHIFDEFFNEVSVWFLIFMLTSFLIGYITAWWIYRLSLRTMRKQVRRLKQEIIEIRLIKESASDEKDPHSEKQQPPIHN